MATTIKLKNSVTTTNTPTSLVQGEVAINITDKKVWVGNAATTPIQLLGAGSSASFGALTCTSLTNSGLTSGRVTYAGTAGLLQDDADFTFNGTTVTMANDASISGLTVGRGGGSAANTTVLGNGAVAATNTGDYLTAVGYQALAANTSGIGSTAIGWNSLKANTTGRNTAFGTQSLALNTTGSSNTAIGDTSLYNNTTASNNVALGTQSLNSNTTASNNTAVGYQAGYSNTTGGIQAFGRVALYSNTTGVNNAGFGNQALFSNTTGGFNTAFGDESLRQNTTASNNTAVGYQAGYSNTTGGGNSGQNTFIGDTAGYSTTSDLCTFVGRGAGSSVTSGRKNTILGTYNGNQGGLDLRTSNNNIVLSDGDGNIRIWVTGGGETLVAGITDNGAYNLQCNGTGVWGAGAYVNGSDERIKDNITPLDSGLDVIAKLNPVTYKYKETWSKDQSTQTGFIAQELLTALDGKNYADGVVQQGGSQGYYSVAYQNIIPILVKAIQELKAEVDSLKQQLGK
jgi:hypothetical protein